MAENVPIPPPCPKCLSSDVRWLLFVKAATHTNTLRCIACGNVWRETSDPNDPAGQEK